MNKKEKILEILKNNETVVIDSTGAGVRAIRRFAYERIVNEILSLFPKLGRRKKNG